MKNTQSIKSKPAVYHSSVKFPGIPHAKGEKNRTIGPSDHHLAFDNSLQANIICIVADDKIIKANRAACRLLGYSNKELLTKSLLDIFDEKDANFKLLFRQTTDDSHFKAMITGIKKTANNFPQKLPLWYLLIGLGSTNL